MSNSDFETDLILMHTDFAEAVMFHPVAGPIVAGAAFLDAPGSALVGGDILSTDYVLSFPAESFPAVRRGDRFIIGGITYTARESSQPASIDGLEHRVPLSR